MRLWTKFNSIKINWIWRLIRIVRWVSMISLTEFKQIDTFLRKHKRKEKLVDFLYDCCHIMIRIWFFWFSTFMSVWNSSYHVQKQHSSLQILSVWKQLQYYYLTLISWEGLSSSLNHNCKVFLAAKSWLESLA